MAELIISEKAAKSVKAGHPWVYSEEVREVRGSYAGGDLVSVLNSKGKWLGAGFVNDVSRIRVRLISRNKNDRFDEDFFRRRVAELAGADEKDIVASDLYLYNRMPATIWGEAGELISSPRLDALI